jgi:hypothetical protein
MSKNNCSGCDKSFDEVSLKRMVIDNGETFKWCRDCCSPSMTAIPDVWYGYGSGTHTEENIADPKTGKPIPFSSKREKAEAMKIAGVKEAGDRVKGYRREDMVPQNRKKYFC